MKEIKCKFCKKEKVHFLINIGETTEKTFKKEGEVYVCENCGKCTILKIIGGKSERNKI